MTKEKKVLLCSLLLTMSIILGRIFSIRLSILTISFSFVPIAISAIILGPKYSIFVATLSDIIGALLFPTGSYFFGFTITEFFTGLIYGIFLHQQEFKMNRKFIMRIIISNILITVLLNGFLNSIWLFFILKDASKIIISVRILKQLITTPIRIIIIYFLCRILEERIGELYQ